MQHKDGNSSATGAMTAAAPQPVWSRPWVWRILLTAGLLARIAVFGMSEMHDMAEYERWAVNTSEQGLRAAYEGIYFPVQYAALAGVLHLASALKLSFAAAFKLVNLGCEIGTLLLLISMLRRAGRSEAWSLVYWLNPYVIALFGLGYIDAQFTVLLLLSCGLVARAPFRGQMFAAGVPFALALFSKPQMLGICAGLLFIVGLWSLREALRLFASPERRRSARAWADLLSPWFFFVPSGVAFVALSFYIDRVHLARFAYSLLATQDILPCLTAHMPNAWYIPAYILRASAGDPIYSVEDTWKVLGVLSARHLGMAVTAGISAWLAWIAVFRRGGHVRSAVVYSCIVSGYLVPFVMTGAHENHAYLAMALMAMAVTGRSRALPWVWLALSALLAANVLGLYGPAAFRAAYAAPWRLAVALTVAPLHVTAALLGALRFRPAGPAGAVGETIALPGP